VFRDTVGTRTTGYDERHPQNTAYIDQLKFRLSSDDDDALHAMPGVK